MKSIGIREAKAKLSALARAAASGTPTVLTDYGKPIAVIGPLDVVTPTIDPSPALIEIAAKPSDRVAFRRLLNSPPFALELDF